MFTHLLPTLTLASGLLAATCLASAAPAQKGQPHDLSLPGIGGQAPAEWTSQAATGQFRLSQFTVPAAPGEKAPATFIIFHFGKNGGGSVPDNVKRWRGMLKAEASTPDPLAVKEGVTERKGLRITSLDLTGTYQERPFPASDQITPRPGYRMLAAVVETTGENGEGPFFLRLVGPGKSVTAAKAGWDKVLASFKTE